MNSHDQADNITNSEAGVKEYDLIIVGAGVAGCAAAFAAARAGLKTLVVERGRTPGAKNMTGGRLYAHSLEALIPRFAEEAPVERCVTRERLSFLTDTEAVTMEYAGQVNPDPAKRSYTVRRATFDDWLWSKAAEKGAELLAGTRVDSLLKEDDFIVGVETAKGEFRAPITLLADGVSSPLGQKMGLTRKPEPSQVAIGVKEILKFTPEQMRDRFECVGDQGMAWLFVGSPTEGHLGGGFLYTNKDSISIGIVFGLHGAGKKKPPLPALMERFKAHPVIACLLDGGTVVQRPAHMVPEGGIGMMPALAGNGILIAGDAAGMCVNIGYTIRGMDFAIAAGRYAAETAVQAHRDNRYNRDELQLYVDLLERSFVLKEMSLYSKAPEALNNERVFTAYPELACKLMGDMFTVDGQAQGLMAKFWGRARETGAINLIKDGFSLLGAI